MGMGTVPMNQSLPSVRLVANSLSCAQRALAVVVYASSHIQTMEWRATHRWYWSLSLLSTFWSIRNEGRIRWWRSVSRIVNLFPMFDSKRYPRKAGEAT